MTKRGLVAAAMLVAGLLSCGSAAAASSGATFGDYFGAAVRTAGDGARTPEIRRRRVTAALSPLVTQAIVQQPGQVDAIMRGLMAAAPGVAPAVAEQAMSDFPGYAGEIAHATGLQEPQTTELPRYMPPVTSPAPHGNSGAHRANGHAARVAAWAISAIADNPGALDDVVARAVAAAPGGEVAVVAAVQAAYPGFAAQISAAAAAPRTVSRRPTTPAPKAPVPLARPPVKYQAAAPAPVMRKQTPPPAARTSAAPPRVAQTRTAPPPLKTQPVAPALVMRQAPAPATETTELASSDQESAEIEDPLEPMNRIIFAFNDTLDLILLRPIAKGYNWIMPDLLAQAVRRAMLNLDSPVIAANDLLQGELSDAGVTVGRFVLNSTIGFLGLLDPAADFGLERHHADFGQTLHSYDVGAGPYLVLPLLGPASTRGGVGKLVDIFFQPLTYMLSTGENLAVAGTRAVIRREELLDPLDELRENSVDYYTGLKAAFWQARQVELNKGVLNGLGNSGTDKLFDAAN